MKIESKFNGLDTVWTMHQNRLHSFSIMDIEWSASNGFAYTDSSHEWFAENEVFASRDELIEHLKKM